MGPLDSLLQAAGERSWLSWLEKDGDSLLLSRALGLVGHPRVGWLAAKPLHAACAPQLGRGGQRGNEGTGTAHSPRSAPGSRAAGNSSLGSSRSPQDRSLPWLQLHPALATAGSHLSLHSAASRGHLSRHAPLTSLFPEKGTAGHPAGLATRQMPATHPRLHRPVLPAAPEACHFHSLEKSLLLGSCHQLSPHFLPGVSASCPPYKLAHQNVSYRAGQACPTRRATGCRPLSSTPARLSRLIWLRLAMGSCAEPAARRAPRHLSSLPTLQVTPRPLVKPFLGKKGALPHGTRDLTHLPGSWPASPLD